jgi:hypothetical protein
MDNDIYASKFSFGYEKGGFLNIVSRGGCGLFIGAAPLPSAEISDIHVRYMAPIAQKRVGRWLVLKGAEDMVGSVFLPEWNYMNDETRQIPTDKEVNKSVLDDNGFSILGFEDPDTALTYFILCCDHNALRASGVSFNDLFSQEGIWDLLKKIGYTDIEYGGTRLEPSPNLVHAIQLSLRQRNSQLRHYEYGYNPRKPVIAHSRLSDYRNLASVSYDERPEI